jgi:hypothetical protein
MQRVEHLLEKLIEVGHNVERDVALAGLSLPGHRRPGYFTPASELQSSDSSNPPVSITYNGRVPCASAEATITI